MDAASAAHDLIKAWSPRYVVVVGIAGGVPRGQLGLGDVVVADSLIEYEHAKELRDLTERRPRFHRTNALVLDRVRALEDWQGPVSWSMCSDRNSPSDVISVQDTLNCARQCAPASLSIERPAAGGKWV